MEDILASVKITTSEYAFLRGCSEQYIRRLCDKGKIRTERKTKSKGGGNSGVSYMIPLTSLSDREVKRYLKKHSKDEIFQAAAADPEEQEKIIDLTYETLTARQREELNLKNRVLAGWKSYRQEERKKGIPLADADAAYVRIVMLQYPEMAFSKATLFRWDKVQKDHGELAILDGRGRHGHHAKKMTPELFDIFQYYYLDESRKSASMCVTLTKLEAKKRGLDVSKEKFPTERAFVRWISTIKEPVLMYFRYGEKAMKDKCLPYIHRSYTDLQANDIWVSDNHTFDIIVAKDEKPLRVYLTAFLDVRSRKFVGHHVTLNPSADATLYALRRGIERYGIPKRILTDNGREFLTIDIGGRGFRKKSKEQDPQTIMDRLGIDFKTAMVKNARAKIIERSFLTVKEEFSKLFSTYTGGNVVERPERLKNIVKDVNNITVLEDFETFVTQYLEGWYNYRKHTGFGMNGQTPNEVYKRTLVEVRKASKEVLDIMLLRSTRLQKVTRAGVKLSFYGEEVYFYNEELLMNHQGEQVFVRYNPRDLASVRVYDSEDRYILTAEQDKGLSYMASKEEVAAKMKEQRTFGRMAKAYKKEHGLKGTKALELMMEAATQNMGPGEQLDPDIIEIMRNPDAEFNEREIAKAVGDDLDWGKANEKIRLLQRKESE